MIEWLKIKLIHNFSFSQNPGGKSDFALIVLMAESDLPPGFFYQNFFNMNYVFNL